MLQQDILNYLKIFKNSSKNRLFTEIGLFGSYAKNSADRYSDIDVAVRIDPKYLSEHDVWDYFDALKKIQDDLLKKFHLKSDIFDLDSVSPLKDKIESEIIYV
jgi:predicted nucleotidyltransferase